MKDINITYLPGEILPDYRGDRVLFVVSNGMEDPTLELRNLNKIVGGELGPDNAIRTYLGVSSDILSFVERGVSDIIKKRLNAFSLDKLLVIDARAEMRYEQVCGLLERQKEVVQDMIMSDAQF